MNNLVQKLDRNKDFTKWKSDKQLSFINVCDHLGLDMKNRQHLFICYAIEDKTAVEIAEEQLGWLGYTGDYMQKERQLLELIRKYPEVNYSVNQLEQYIEFDHLSFELLLTLICNRQATDFFRLYWHVKRIWRLFKKYKMSDVNWPYVADSSKSDEEKLRCIALICLEPEMRTWYVMVKRKTYLHDRVNNIIRGRYCHARLVRVWDVEPNDASIKESVENMRNYFRQQGWNIDGNILKQVHESGQWYNEADMIQTVKKFFENNLKFDSDDIMLSMFQDMRIIHPLMLLILVFIFIAMLLIRS